MSNLVICRFRSIARIQAIGKPFSFLLIAMITLTTTPNSFADQTSAESRSIRQNLEELASLKNQTEDFLANRTEVLNREMTLSGSGSIKGQINGKYVEHSPITMGVLGATLGAATSTALVALAAPLVTVAGLGTLALAGAGAGAVTGILAGPPVAQGSLAGSTEGNLKIEGWENKNMADVFVLNVSDHAFIRKLKNILDTNQRNVSQCSLRLASNFLEIEKETVDISEARRFFESIEKVNRLRKQINIQAIESPHSLSSSDINFMTNIDNWLNKRVIVTYIGAQDLIVNSVSYRELRIPYIGHPNSSQLFMNRPLFRPGYLYRPGNDSAVSYATLTEATKNLGDRQGNIAQRDVTNFYYTFSVSMSDQDIIKHMLSNTEFFGLASLDYFSNPEISVRYLNGKTSGAYRLVENDQPISNDNVDFFIKTKREVYVTFPKTNSSGHFLVNRNATVTFQNISHNDTLLQPANNPAIYGADCNGGQADEKGIILLTTVSDDINLKLMSQHELNTMRRSPRLFRAENGRLQ